MSLNVLFVSIAFPPKLDPECLQTAKYFKYLVRDKSLNIDVVTSPDKTLFMPIDKNLEKYAQGYRQIIKVPFFENKYVNFLMRKISTDSLNYPDSKFRFYKKYKNILKQLKNKPDIIYSRSFPISSTLMAYHLQKELDVPWVLHLSDPWTISPIHHLGTAKDWNEKMERICFSQASVLSFTSEKTIELYSQKYPEYKAKMKLFPNVFDLEDKVDREYHLKEKIKFVYTGGLIGRRTPKSFLDAVDMLSKEYHEIVSDYEFVFAGALDRTNKHFFTKSKLPVRHMGELSFSQALDLQNTADVLLVIDTPFQNVDDALFFPSKLLDYMLMQKRILALTDRNSTTWNIVDGKLGDCYEHQDSEGIKKFLIHTWKAWKEKKTDYFFHNQLDLNFSAEENALKLKRLFFKLDGDFKDAL